MFKKIKILSALFIFLFISSIVFPIYADDLDYEDVSYEIQSSIPEGNLDLNSRSCVVLDRLSKNIIYGKNEKNKVKMASTTKIMTAIVVIENASSLYNTVEVSKKAANTGGSRLGLKTGDKITICDLMYGLLLCSGNDAAVCLAESIAGSVPDFANLMNAKAEELGLTNSHFESPHGLDSDGHYTTAYKLALLSDYALKNSTFLNIVGTKSYTVTINGYPKTITNTNELLGNLNGVYGIKTGFTNGANRCLVTACKRGDMDIICVVLGADTKKFRTQDSIKLIEYTFKNYEYFNIKDFVDDFILNWQKDNSNFFTIEKGVFNNLRICVDNSINEKPVIPLKKEFVDKLEATISLNSYLKAPVDKNTLLGNLSVSYNGTTITSFDVLADNSIKKNNVFDYMLSFFRLYPSQFEIPF